MKKKRGAMELNGTSGKGSRVLVRWMLNGWVGILLSSNDDLRY